ncbi:Glycosyltransferase involved in cell wall bisynthesis [Virgibacillus subterraneus]|uniref:Glycosyltransferase involved in cell wall bisynthesis n=1 Tax=Virgibacillus subterraneus TaxID=621109 RepID=A0A1H9AII5_9BACI|nr:glycosyltransferase family 4 protein [Virgibacillus subterraneus]SEP76203.1 Glycosyltransferase involved in cell wall bisynthesis [Virgibacillus subterraneus]
MKILFITTLYPGYKEQSRQKTSYALHYFAKDWVKSGHEVNVIRLWPKYSKLFSFTNKGKQADEYGNEAEFNLDGVSVNRQIINKYPKIDYLSKDIQEVYNYITKNIKNDFIPDVIVCHMINPSLYIASLLKEELNKPLMLVMHHSDISQLQSMKKRLNKYRHAEQFIDRIGFRSHKLYKEFGTLPILNNNLLKDAFIINSGINRKDIISIEKIRQKIMSPPKIIFIASSMIPLKNIDVVIKAFDEISKKHNIKLRIAGDGPEREKLLGLAKKSNAQENIEFLGYIPREAVMEHMEKSDIYVMVSSPETFGLVYVEAMGNGCITIGSKGEGIDGTIINGENGFLSEPGNIHDLKLTLLKVLRLDKTEREKITNNALETAKNQTQEQLAMYYLEVMKETIDNYKNN